MTSSDMTVTIFTPTSAFNAFTGVETVQAENHNVVLGLMSECRDDLAEERTRTANRLHAPLRDLIPGGAERNLTAAAASLLRMAHPLTGIDEQRKSLANRATKSRGQCAHESSYLSVSA